MSRTTSVQLGDELDDMLNEEIEAGEFSSASQAMRIALTRLLEDRRKERQILQELEEAEREIAGRTPEEHEHFSLERVLARFRARHPEYRR